MSNPDQLKSLATISSLAISMQKQTLSDIQLDLLEVAEHLMTNIAVQSTLHGREGMQPAEPPAPLEFQVGEPVEVQVPADRVHHEHWQRTTIIDKKVTEEEGETVTRYQTAFTKRDFWISAKRLRKVAK